MSKNTFPERKKLSEQTIIQKSIEDRILFLMINNPPDNRLPTVFFSELYNCLGLMSSIDIDAVVFSGQGRCFSKGADLDEISTNETRPDLDLLMLGNDVFTRISRLGKPVIAAINGACFGGGLELSLACHIRVCAEKARMGLPEASIGLIPGLGGIERLVRTVGEPKALEMILLGDLIPATKALDLNLVSRIFPRKEFLKHVKRFVRTLLDTNHQALSDVLELVSMTHSAKENTNIRAAAERFMHLLESDPS